jgi:ABC-type Fe3+-hydroxamate transport system substrate-binding protein
MAKITAADPDLIAALAGLGIDTQNTRRVVIDIQASHAPVVHVELFGSDKVIDVVRTLSGVEIERKDSEHG